MELPGIPPLRWLDQPGDATIEPGLAGPTLTLAAGPNTDWFHDPCGPTRVRSAPVLAFRPDADVVVSATVRPELVATFDAGVLFVWAGPDDYAKLCLERSPAGRDLVVSVVTGGTSDDANGPDVTGETVRLRVALIGGAIAFHHSIDGTTWHLTRLFRLRNQAGPPSIGFAAQSPTGDGCVCRFDDLRAEARTLTELRDGS
ncbi:MAG: DUF1349 domain-containing protein [Actinomycetota bacterium]